MRNNRKKRRRQKRARMKRAAASEALAKKIEESVYEQKVLAEKYCAKWKKVVKEARDLRSRLQRQPRTKQIASVEKCVNTVSDVNHTSRGELTQLNEHASVGSGTFGECTLKMYKWFNLVVLEKQLPISDGKDANHILTHPNIPQLLGVQIECKPYALIMEFIGEDMKSSTVHQLLQESNAKCSPLLTPEWVSVCVDIVEAVNHIHSKWYLHCDLKTSNVLAPNHLQRNILHSTII